MRVNRAKMVRKYLRFYKLVYGLDGARGGYALIIDGNFIFACLKVKIDIKERMVKLLQGADVRLFVTKSILSELQAIGAKGQAAYEYAKRSCELINDDHLVGETASQKLVKLLQQQHRDWLAAPTSGSGNRGNVRRYLVASQDKELRVSLGSIPGVPLIYLNMVAIVLEPPSNASKEFNKEIEAHKVSLSSSELSVVQRASKQKTKKRKAPGGDDDDEDEDEGKEEQDDDDEDEEEEDQEDEQEQAVVAGGERKKHKAKAPNPLAALAPKQDSSRQKRLKSDKFKRR